MPYLSLWHDPKSDDGGATDTPADATLFAPSMFVATLPRTLFPATLVLLWSAARNAHPGHPAKTANPKNDLPEAI